jgi:hypothetical protein
MGPYNYSKIAKVGGRPGRMMPLVRRNIKPFRAAGRQRAIIAQIAGVSDYLPVRWPKICIELAVVGIAASRSQGCGIAELPVTT